MNLGIVVGSKRVGCALTVSVSIRKELMVNTAISRVVANVFFRASDFKKFFSPMCLTIFFRKMSGHIIMTIDISSCDCVPSTTQVYKINYQKKI